MCSESMSSPTEETQQAFDRSKWHVAEWGPEATAEEFRRNEVCESYIRSADWAPSTPVSIRGTVAANVRGAWPVAFTQGWNAATERANKRVTEITQELDHALKRLERANKRIEKLEAIEPWRDCNHECGMSALRAALDKEGE